jgi:transglutaminase-like putative cysteine protease
MRLAIRHISRYQYDQPVPYALQRLRLRPQSGPGQKVLAWSVSVNDKEPDLSYTDGLGNRVDLMRHEKNIRDIVVVAHGEIETQDLAGVAGETGGYAPPWVFERATPLTQAGPPIKALAEAVRGEDPRLTLLHRLMGEVHGRIAYVCDTTDAGTDAETALQRGQGVCQDHAQVFISAARVLKIPARYVSGYLLMDNVTLQKASHAWAEAYVDGLGWVGFDPANNVCPDARNVRIATGLDYCNAMPVSGVRTGEGVETLTVELHVAKVADEARA